MRFLRHWRMYPREHKIPLDLPRKTCMQIQKLGRNIIVYDAISSLILYKIRFSLLIWGASQFRTNQIYIENSEVFIIVLLRIQVSFGLVPSGSMNRLSFTAKVKWWRTAVLQRRVIHLFGFVKEVWKFWATLRNCKVKRPGVAQRVVRGIALLFHDHSTRRGWVVSSTPRPHFTTGKDPVPILEDAVWAPGTVWTGGKSRPHRDSIPDRSARSQSLYRLSYPAHT